MFIYVNYYFVIMHPVDIVSVYCGLLIGCFEILLL